ncbi:MAG: nitric oxide reductase activation protein, partial [Lachnospiraceae bacterium]|nr:nitric oxide reductase activation protein [Lachnospiraceae bacterium]
RAVDILYNTVIDPQFERLHGDLDKILAVTLEEMRETDWRSFAEEEAWAETLERLLKDEADLVTRFDAEPSEEKQKKEKKRKARQIIRVDEAALEKMHGYVELTFGRSYMSEAQTKRLCYRLCRGAHADCSLYYTDGVAVNPVIVNAQHVNAVRHVRNNQRLFLNMQNVIRRNVESLTAYLKRALELRTMTEQIPSTAGTVIPARLWKVGRLEDPGKLFYRTTKALSTEFAVEILMDGSGSQRERQGLVAIQAYIISAALSGIGLPHRIESFCAFWDYTIMQRLRDFDEPPQADQKVLQFVTSSNNRDGLAIRAAGDTLLQRREENRILIVLSDGKPNDVIVNRPGSRNPVPYCGDYGVKDTAFEIRSLRAQGVYVLGVFTGKEKDLSAEKLIFGKDFAYVRDIRNFSRIVGLYLHRLLEQDTGSLA